MSLEEVTQEFAKLKFQVDELMHFKEEHTTNCTRSRSEMWEALTKVRIEQAKLTAYSIIGGMIGSAVIAAVISELFSRSVVSH